MVSVPVLSNTTVSTRESNSSALPLRTTICRRAARLMPPITATGVARMSGQGVATTSTASTRVASPEIHHAMMQTMIVTGVNQMA